MRKINIQVEGDNPKEVVKEAINQLSRKGLSPELVRQIILSDQSLTAGNVSGHQEELLDLCDQMLYVTKILGSCRLSQILSILDHEIRKNLEV